MADPSRSMSPPPGDDWENWNPYEAHPTDRIVQYTEDCGRLVKERLEQDGVAIIKGVGLEDMYDELTADFGQWLALRGVDMRDNTTWCKYTNDHLTMSPSIPGMMNTGSICFSKVPLKTRCQPAVQQVFASLYNVRREDLVMEIGGVFYGFPPEHHEGGKIATQPTGGYHHWSEMWMHSDRGRDVHAPVRYQCTIQLSEAGVEDHAFAFMSGSHLVADEFFNRNEKLELENENKLAMQQASGRVGEKDNFLQLSYADVKWFEERGCKWSKIVAPKGCVIIWDGRLIHSTCKPLRGRADPKPRFIVYGGLVPRSLLTVEDYYKRQARASSECVGDAAADVSALAQAYPMLPSQLAIDGPPPFLLHYYQEQQRVQAYEPALPPSGSGKRGRKRGPTSPLSPGEHRPRRPQGRADMPTAFLSVYPPAPHMLPYSNPRLPNSSISSSVNLFRLFLTAPLLAQSSAADLSHLSSLPSPSSVSSMQSALGAAPPGDAPIIKTQEGPVPLDKSELQLAECRALRALLDLKRRASGVVAAPEAGTAPGPSNDTTSEWVTSVLNPIEVHEPCGASFLNATLP